jgi:hypothetical protein
MLLPRDLVEMLSAFGEEDVRYLVVGGHAVGVHARPRSTKDLDVWLDPSQKNVSRACQALRGFGVPARLCRRSRALCPAKSCGSAACRLGSTCCCRSRCRLHCGMAPARGDRGKGHSPVRHQSRRSRRQQARRRPATRSAGRTSDASLCEEGSARPSRASPTQAAGRVVVKRFFVSPWLASTE